MNIMIDRLLAHSGFRWDPSTWYPMIEFWKAQSMDDQAEFVEAARAMTLGQYEKTVYWGIISGHVVSIDKRCRNCASPYALQVHHTTYEHRGWEHWHLRDLVTLCRLCHTAQHEHMTIQAAKDRLARIGDNAKTLDEVIQDMSAATHDRRIHARENRNRRSPWD